MVVRMRPLVGGNFDMFRIRAPKEFLEVNGMSDEEAMGDTYNGCFRFPNPLKHHGTLRVVASSGLDWDHVSVSLEDRCPYWDEMEWIKRRFFLEDEIAFQLHVKTKDYINRHPFTLHLWR